MASVYTGVWLPQSLLKADGLTLTDKVIIAYCDSFSSGCFASNAHIAEKTNIPEKTVRNTLTKLRRMGLMKNRKFPDVQQVIAKLSQNGACAQMLSQKRAPMSQIGAFQCPKMGHIDKSIDKSIDKGGSPVPGHPSLRVLAN